MPYGNYIQITFSTLFSFLSEAIPRVQLPSLAPLLLLFFCFSIHLNGRRERERQINLLLIAEAEQRSLAAFLADSQLTPSCR